MAKIGRNQPCPCGSGRKYKKCCGDPLNQQAKAKPASAPAPLTAALRQNAADEILRVKQQGLGRPIVSGKIGGYTLVAAGNTIHYSRNWKTFTDFLTDYIKTILGPEWGNAELAKPLAERHPILQWYDSFCRFQATHQEKAGDLYSAPMTGVVICYLGLAYSLYLLKHNVDLQSRLVARLKDIQQFQGAYYELVVANCLIRAGFTLELEDEADQTAKHCEYSARSKATGTKYWIEAKMRSVPNVLGKTLKDGSTSNDPTSSLTRHLREALRKPAPDQRIIFIDLNTKPLKGVTQPAWLERAVRRLDARERDLADGQEAYVFVTNMAFHRALDSSTTGSELLAHGLGINDFGKPGEIRLSVWYRQKQKHIDAHKIIEVFKTFPQIPDTFDGQPASDAFADGKSRRIRIGETYFFEGIEGEGEIGTVSSVAVMDPDRKAYVAISTPDGKAKILKNDLSDAEYEDYKRYGDAYFGAPHDDRHECNDLSEFYEWLVNCYFKTPRDRMLELAKDHPNIERLKELSDFDLVLEICESWAAASYADRNRNRQNGKSAPASAEAQAHPGLKG